MFRPEEPGAIVTPSRSGLLILGNQLFPIRCLRDFSGLPVFMAEDVGLCTYVRHHQQKIVLFLAAMREYAELLRCNDFVVDYHGLEQDGETVFEEKLADFVARYNLRELVHFEIEDRFFAERIARFCADHDITETVVESPMFLTARSGFAAYLEHVKRPFMADFYKRQRRELGILTDEDGAPSGGKWSFDEANRKKLPREIEPPPLPRLTPTKHTRDVIALVTRQFGDHPGRAGDFWWPVTRDASLAWLDDFVARRLVDFGPYEDALSRRSDTVFHSVLSPLLNLGLLTPRDVLDRVLDHARVHEVPLNSLEGFVRQVIGWREFVRGIYRHFGERQENENFWGHRRGLAESWYRGETGIVPLDHAIRTAERLGWTHHITRLMVIGNLMTLAEIAPRAAHDWFMEMYVDSSDWVMGPNVYGMAIFSDGGIFATKPYICGSNYLLKMSDFGRGEWCDVVDGLYWRFIDKHQGFFAANPRLAMMARMLDRLESARRERIFAAAEGFLAAHTVGS